MSQALINDTSRLDTTDWPGLSDQDDPYQVLADYMVRSLETARGTLEQFIKGLEGAEKAKAEKVKKQVEDYLEQLKKAQKASGLQKFFKALGAIGMILAIISAVLVPSPMTIAMLVVTTAMFMDSIISDAAGTESLTQKSMSALVKSMSEALGPVAATVMANLIMITVVVAATAAVGGGATLLMNSTNATAQSLSNAIREIPQMLMSLFRSELTESQSQALRTFLEVAQSSILLAQSGLGVDIALINFEVAELTKDYSIDQTLIDAWAKIIAALNKDMGFKQEFLAYLERLMPDLFGKTRQ